MFYNKTIEEIQKELNLSSEGLTSEEATNRIKKYGKSIFRHLKRNCF